MYRLYDFPSSGNGYKVRLLLHLLAKPFEYRTIDILRGESRTKDFLEKNANGRIPVLEIDDGTFLSESNAILFFLADGTEFFPKRPLDRARVMQWMFFEQYSHEPNIATSRFIRHYRDIDAATERVLAQKKKLGDAALAVMDDHLDDNDFFAAGRYTIADVALYAYTHVADEGGFDLGGYPSVRRWLGRVAAHPRHVPITYTG